MSAADDRDLALEVLRSPEQFAALGPEWSRLHDACPAAGPPLSFAWLSGWWDIFAPHYAAEDGLRIVVGRRGGELVAAAPLYLTRPRGPLRIRELRPLSTGEAEHEESCADYLDPLALDGCREPFIQALDAAMAAGRLGVWDRLIWPAVVAPDSLAAVRGATATSMGDCYLLDLSGGYEAYLTRLSRETRRKTRRYLNTMEANGLEFAIAGDIATAAEMFTELVELHQSRWQRAGQPGCYAAARFRAFHRRLVETLAPRRELVLARLRHGDRTLAVIQGFRHGTKLDFYQSGVEFDAGDASRNAGVTCYLACLRELAEEGLETADFLLGDAVYKQRQSTSRRPLHTVIAVGSWRGRLATAWSGRRQG